MIFAASSPTGEPRLRIEIVLRLKPEVLAELRLHAERAGLSGQDELHAVTTRLERAVELDLGAVELVSSSRQAYREPPPPLDPTSMYRDLMDRLPLNKREPWEDPPP